MIDKDKHLNINSIQEIINIRASLNKGLSDKLKARFSLTVKVERPAISMPKKINYYWFAGFFSAEGCFNITIYKPKKINMKYYVTLEMAIGQHSKDELLIKNLHKFLKCGNTFKYSNEDFIRLRVRNFKDIYHKIIPLFKKYKIEGIKYLDFQDFCEVAELINKKAHLTLEGYEQIKIIKSRMNKARYLINKRV